MVIKVGTSSTSSFKDSMISAGVSFGSPSDKNINTFLRLLCHSSSIDVEIRWRYEYICNSFFNHFGPCLVIFGDFWLFLAIFGDFDINFQFFGRKLALSS